jgi:hypothetical protein
LIDANVMTIGTLLLCAAAVGTESTAKTPGQRLRDGLGAVCHGLLVELKTGVAVQTAAIEPLDLRSKTTWSLSIPDPPSNVKDLVDRKKAAIQLPVDETVAEIAVQRQKNPNVVPGKHTRGVGVHLSPGRALPLDEPAEHGRRRRIVLRGCKGRTFHHASGFDLNAMTKGDWSELLVAYPVRRQDGLAECPHAVRTGGADGSWIRRDRRDARIQGARFPRS